MSAARIIERLEGVRETGPGTWRAQCPACGGKSQKISIRELDDGRILMHDFGGCTVDDVLSAIGLNVGDLFPDRPHDHRYPPSRSAMPAREALACIDHEVLVATLILADVLAARSFTPEQFDRLSRCAALIGDARAKSCPARLPRQNA